MDKEYRNIYRIARESTDLTQDKAAELADVSVNSIAAYESGRRVPSSETVIILADTYKYPELLNDYCLNCPVGKRVSAPLNKENLNNIYKLILNLCRTLNNGNEIGEDFMDIFADGKVDKDEQELFEIRFSQIKELNLLTNDFIVFANKMDFLKSNRLNILT